MTKLLKTKNVRKKRNLASKKVKLAASSRSPLRHLKLVEHKHTLKLIHHKHTSHIALFIVLAAVGIFLYASQSIARAEQVSLSQSVSVGLVVSGAPPKVGATITSPLNGSSTTAAQIDVTGTCGNELLVIIYDNGQADGTTRCSVAGIFDITIQLYNGENALQALNYDTLNQAGPATPTVTITSNQTTALPAVTAQAPPTSSLTSPFIIPAISTKKDCSSYNGPSVTQGGQLWVSVVCFVRDLNPTSNYQMGVLIRGGKAPYALDIAWGAANIKDRLVSLVNPGYQAIDFSYPLPGVFTIKIHASDNDGEQAYTQTIAEVNGTPSSNIITTLQNDVFGKSWFETPVPFYLIAVTLTFGFWIGDLFDRRFGAKKVRRRSA